MKIPVVHNCDIEVTVDVSAADLAAELFARLGESPESKSVAYDLLEAAIRILERFPFEKINTGTLGIVDAKIEAVFDRCRRCALDAKGKGGAV